MVHLALLSGLRAIHVSTRRAVSRAARAAAVEDARRSREWGATIRFVAHAPQPAAICRK
jgi:hypothetical protein